MSAGWLTAQPDRLKRFISPSKKTLWTVIASEAKQSIATSGDVDCFVAVLLAMTENQNDSDETTLTFWAGSSFCTPSVTTFAPSSTPPEMTT